MANTYREQFFEELQQRFGVPKKLTGSNSLYEFVNGGPILYLRYSKLHSKGGTFFGLRQDDLRRMQGRSSFIVFLTDGALPPLFLPFSEFEEVLLARPPASDGQYKVQLYPAATGTQLYIARSGRFNVEGYLGWSEFEKAMSPDQLVVPVLSHSQVQTLLGSIGIGKGYDVWIPACDRGILDWSVAQTFDCMFHTTFGVRWHPTHPTGSRRTLAGTRRKWTSFTLRSGTHNLNLQRTAPFQ